MKRIAILWLLLFATSAEAQIKQITGGGYQNSNGTACSGCILYLQLPVDATVTGTGQIVPNLNSYTLDANGNVPANSNLWANDQLTPTGLTYKATLTLAGGGRIWGPEFLSITGVSPISLTQLVPVASSSVFFGNPAILTQNNTFTGTQTFSNLTVSGTGTFTGAVTCTIINAIRCVSPSNPQGWAGSDVGAWINSAYANCAAASLVVCPIQVASGSYASSATLINFSTLGVFPQLICPSGGGATITFSATSGTAITLNPGRAGLPIDWGISGCKFIGSGLGNTLTGILSGGTNGAVGAALRGIQLGAFNIALTFGTNVQAWIFDHSVAGDNNQNFVLPNNLTQTGEGIVISNSTVSQSTNLTWSATCVSIGNAAGTLYDVSFINDMLDSCGVTQGTGTVVSTFKLHQENPQNVTIGGGAYWIVNGGQVTHNSPTWVSEETITPTYFVDSTAGGIINITGMTAINNGGSSMTAVHICATCSGTMTGSLNVSGTQTIVDSLTDTGGILAKFSKGSFSMVGGGTGGPFELRPNTGQTISGITGDLAGWLQSGVAHLGEMDHNGNMGVLGTLHQSISTTTANVAGSVIPLSCATSQKTESAADANVLTCAIPAAAGSYRIRFVISVSAANAATLGWTATWTDSNGTAQTPTNMSLFQTGVAAPALTFTTSAAGNYYSDAQVDVNNAGTSIVIKLTFSGTSFTAKVSASVERLI